jgi:hypothetical protein
METIYKIGVYYPVYFFAPFEETEYALEAKQPHRSDHDRSNTAAMIRNTV